MAKKSLTFNAEEIQELLLFLQNKKDDPYEPLYGVGIALFYFWLLRANEVKPIEMVDVDLNRGFTYNVSSTFFSIYKIYIKQICMNMVRSGKVGFLKNWSDKVNRNIKNTGKYLVNELHKVLPYA